MCLVAVAFHWIPGYPLVIVANRDEFHERSSLPANWWQDDPDILGGRDLQAGGSWLAMHRDGRVALVTNYRDPAHPYSGRLSRGMLVHDFLTGDLTARDYVARLHSVAPGYAGFSLLLGDANEIWYFSNRDATARCLEPGVHGLSNHLLNSPWPKVETLRKRLAKLSPGQADEQHLFPLMTDTSIASDGDLPDTGVGLERERGLSPAFVRLPGYGTRCTTVIRQAGNGSISFAERSFDGNARATGTLRFCFRLATLAAPASTVGP